MIGTMSSMDHFIRLINQLTYRKRNGYTANQTEEEQFKAIFNCGMIIVDEAATILEENMTVLPFFYPSRMVVIGDEKQLRPYTNSNEVTRSFLERALDAGCPTIMLIMQYRCPFDQGTLFSALSYDKKLKHKSKETNTMVFKNSNSKEEEKGTSYINRGEAKKCIKFLLQLMRNPKHKEDIFKVIIFYEEQMLLVKELVKELFDNKAIKLNGVSKFHRENLMKKTCICTVDGCQGTEADIVIIGLVRSNDSNRIGFTKQPNRLNVALSRARKKLIFVGNKNTFKSESNPLFLKIIEAIENPIEYIDDQPEAEVPVMNPCVLVSTNNDKKNKKNEKAQMVRKYNEQQDGG